MSDSPKMAVNRLKHFADAVTEFNEKMKIKGSLAQFEGDDRVAAEALLCLQEISTLNS
jgi:hypothetical protein